MKFRCGIQIFLFSWIIFVLCGCISLQKKKYRLVPGEQTSVLVPPGISVSKQSRIVSFHSHQSNKACDPGVGLLPVKKKKLHLRVSVTRQQLERLEPGSLNTLGIRLLEKECLVGGRGI